MPFRVVIDKQSCQSSGSCMELEPAAFAWDDDDLGDPLPAAGDLPRERLLEVARRCPALAIGVFDERGREIGVPD